MISPKVRRLSPAEERAAYAAATERDDDRCQKCLRDCGRGVTSRHHRKGRGVGGRTEVVNLVVLGGTGTTGCHGEVTGNPAEAINEGWACPGWADPALWPARRWIRTAHGTVRLGWVILDHFGGFEEISTIEAYARMGRIG